jgi:hypothetical protein
MRIGKKAIWETPKLTVLVRCNKQEEVLASCKFAHMDFTSNPNGYNIGCNFAILCTLGCSGRTDS